MKTETIHEITPKMQDSSFLAEVRKIAEKTNFLDCMQCGVCGGSCPARFAMDFSPMQIIKMIQLGLKDIVLSRSTIWICAQCQTCLTRCPREVNIPLLMSSLKNIAIRENVPCKIETKPKFHKTFSEIIKKYGRMYEPELKMKLIKKTNPGDVFHNAILAVRLLRKGKIKLMPPKTDQSRELSAFFETASEEEKK